VNRRRLPRYRHGHRDWGGTTEHHRKPRSKGGKKKWPPGNIALLPCRAHELWHRLFITWPANVVAAEATRYLPPGVIFVAVPMGRRRFHPEAEWHRRWRENRPTQTKAWEELFLPKKRTPQEIAAIISRYYLDPEFTLMAVDQHRTVVNQAAG